MRTHLILAGGGARRWLQQARPRQPMIVRPVPGSAACGAAAGRSAEVARLSRRDQGREFGGLGVAEVLRQQNQERGQASRRHAARARPPGSRPRGSQGHCTARWSARKTAAAVRRSGVRRSGSRGAPAAARGACGLSRGGLPGRLVTLRAGTLQFSLGVLGAGLEGGAGVFGRRDLGFEPRSQPGLVPRGVLAGLGHLPAGGLAGPVQLRAGRLGRLPRLGRVLPGTAGPGLGLARLILRGPLGLGDPCLRGLVRGHGVLLGGSLRRQRRGQPRIGLLRRSTRLSGLTLGLLGAGLQGGPGLLGRRDLGFEPARSPAWSRAASWRAWVTCRSAAWRARSSSARAAWAASRAWAASCPAFLARDSAAATRSSAARRAWAICARAASASCSAAAFAVSAPASRASACCAAARASPASASARARRRQNADPGRAGSSGPAAPRSCRASSCRRRNAVSAVCGCPVTGSGSPQYPGSAP